jgi:hypothetical protein
MTVGCSSARRLVWPPDQLVRNEEERVAERRAQAWVGIDAGKGHHWAAVVDQTGATLWSSKRSSSAPSKTKLFAP